MKAFLVTAGVIFGLVTVAHMLRIVFENARLATDPFFLLLTILSAGLSAWAFVLLWRSRKRS
jgi:hypothetical protein